MLQCYATHTLANRRKEKEKYLPHNFGSFRINEISTNDMVVF